MTRLIEQLQRRDTQGTARLVDLAPIVEAAVARSQSRQPPVAVDGVSSTRCRAWPIPNGSPPFSSTSSATRRKPPALPRQREREARARTGEAQLTDRRRRRGHGRGVPAPAPVPAVRQHQGLQGHGHRRLPGARVRARAGRRRRSVEHTRAGHQFCIRLPICPKKNQSS